MAKKKPKSRPALLAPMSDVVSPPAKAAAKWTKLAPPIAELWERWGWGRFGDGFLLLVDPAEIEETFDQWLGGASAHRVPLGRTALGDLIYFRDLRERAKALGMTGAALEAAYDFSLVDVRYKTATVLATSVSALERSLVDKEWLAEVLRKDLFDDALGRLGPPEHDEMYGFVPAIGLGGAETAAALHRVQADVHLEILFQL